MLTNKDLKEKIESKNASIGSWLQIPNPDVAEIMGQAGYDWIAVDLEHGLFSRQILGDIFRAIELGGTLPMARLADHGLASVKTALDAGARGLIFPMVETRSQLDRLIDMALYPPAGKRGVGYARSNLFGRRFDQGLADNEHTFFCAQVENIHAMDQLDAIMTHPNLDAVMVGPYDFTGSMGITGQFDHPDFLSVLTEIEKKAETHQKTLGCHVVSPEKELLQNQIAKGYRFIAYGTDAVFLYNKAQCPQI